MEKGALVGMMALAGSDLCFCVVTISGTYLHPNVIHYHRDLTFYHTLYGNCVNNILIKSSTWFTVILAVSRHFAVSRPIKARQFMRCGHTVAAIILCLSGWICLHVPLAYLWKVHTVKCSTVTVYVLASGIFQLSTALNTSFTYIWFVAGFAIPVIVLAYCNIKLIYSLRMSTALKENDEILQRGSALRVKQSRDTNQRRISLTLIAIVTMFFVLVLPSEVAHFYEEVAERTSQSMFNTVLLVCNLLQVVNFSANFILYCIVNAYFRKTLHAWCLFLSCRQKPYFAFRSRGKGSLYSMSLNPKNSLVTQNSNVEPPIASL